MALVAKRSLFVVWKDVIFALLLRHLVSKFNDKFGISWLIIQPLSFILVLGLIRGQSGGGDIHGLSPFLFMMLGFASVIQFMQGWSSVSSAIRKDKPLYAFRQVQPIASIVTAIVVELITYIVLMVILVVIAFAMGQIDYISNPLMLIVYLVEIQLIGYALGLFFSILILYVKEVDKVQGVIQRPMLFISGTFFSLNDISADAWVYLTWNPIIHGVELSRNAAYNGFPLVESISEMYLHLFVVLSLFVSLATYTALWKKGVAR